MPQSALLQLFITSAVSYLLPSLLVRSLLSFVYRLFPGLPRTPQHARLAYFTIVGLYIAYTLISSYLSLPLNYYDLLAVSRVSADYNAWKDSTLRPRWLALVKVYHPDKVGGSDDAQEKFRHLQRANEVLKDDALRTAYERYISSSRSIVSKYAKLSIDIGLVRSFWILFHPMLR